jgi:hypothetical protein
MGAPLSYVVKAPRVSELVAWLKCNDVDPQDVPYSSLVFVETPDGEQWFIRHEAYVREDGVIKYDPVANSWEYIEQLTVMVSDPPMSWLVEAAPTGDGAAPTGPVGAEDRQIVTAR